MTSRLITPTFLLSWLVNFVQYLLFYLLVTTTALYAVKEFAASEAASGLAASSFVIGATIAPVQMRDDGELNPVPQTVGWYGPPQWDTTPGERSRYPGVLAGHVIHSGLKDVFWNLQELPTGAVVLLTYDDGTQAVFRTDRPAETMDKDDLTHDPAYGWAWELPEAGHGLTLITCDLVEGSGMTGWSTDNWVTQAHRIA